MTRLGSRNWLMATDANCTRRHYFLFEGFVEALTVFVLGQKRVYSIGCKNGIAISSRLPLTEERKNFYSTCRHQDLFESGHVRILVFENEFPINFNLRLETFSIYNSAWHPHRGHAHSLVINWSSNWPKISRNVWAIYFDFLMITSMRFYWLWGLSFRELNKRPGYQYL